MAGPLGPFVDASRTPNPPLTTDESNENASQEPTVDSETDCDQDPTALTGILYEQHQKLCHVLKEETPIANLPQTQENQVLAEEQVSQNLIDPEELVDSIFGTIKNTCRKTPQNCEASILQGLQDLIQDGDQALDHNQLEDALLYYSSAYAYSPFLSQESKESARGVAQTNLEQARQAVTDQNYPLAAGKYFTVLQMQSEFPMLDITYKAVIELAQLYTQIYKEMTMDLIETSQPQDVDAIKLKLKVNFQFTKRMIKTAKKMNPYVYIVDLTTARTNLESLSTHLEKDLPKKQAKDKDLNKIKRQIHQLLEHLSPAGNPK